MFEKINSKHKYKGHNGRVKTAVGIKYVSYCKKDTYTAKQCKKLIYFSFHKANSFGYSNIFLIISQNTAIVNIKLSKYVKSKGDFGVLGRIFGAICLVATVFGLLCGRGEELGNAVVDGAGEAIGLVISLVGIMALWGGLMRVLEGVGAMRVLARWLSPVLSRFFPDAFAKKNGDVEIAANVSAKLLGMGNAATPFALSAMKKLKENGKGGESATGEMITLAVLNTASFSILPTTLLALRRAAGASDPYSVILPVWIVSLGCSLLALLITRAMGKLKK